MASDDHQLYLKMNWSYKLLVYQVELINLLVPLYNFKIAYTKTTRISFFLKYEDISIILASVSFWPLLIIQSVAHVSQHVHFTYDLLAKQV